MPPFKVSSFVQWRSAHSIFVLFGPENHGSHFERYKTAFEEVTTIDKTRVDKTQLNSSIRTVTARTTYEVVPEGFTSDVAQKDTSGVPFNTGERNTDRRRDKEPVHMKALLATQFNEFEKGPPLFSQWKSLLGTGVFNSDGNGSYLPSLNVILSWLRVSSRFHRNMTSPFFNKDRIRDFEIFDSHAIDTIGQMKKRLAEGHPIEFQDAMARFALDSATEFLCGKIVRSLDAGLPYPKSSGIANPASFTNHPSTVFVNALMKGQELTTRRNRTGTTWPLAEFWGDKVAEQRQIVDGFVKPILADVLAKKASGEKKASEEEDSFFGHLVNYTEDEQVLLDELVNILVASRDTIAALLTFGMYVLTQSPDIAQRLRDEVMKHVGPTSAPSYDIKEMKFLRVFLDETLYIHLYPSIRAGPTAILNPRDSTRPLFVPANTKVLYSIFLFHRRKDLWGPDADEFDPDRFIDHRLHKYLAPNPFIFLPFAGLRICLGQQFAYNEASFFPVCLLENFSSFTFASEAQEDCKLPEHWKHASGTQGRNKIVLRIYLTMFVKVHKPPYHLPLEITREVVSYRESFRDLRNFSFVSRAWRQATLPFLFHGIKIIDEGDMTQCQELLSSSPDITNYIRQLSLSRCLSIPTSSPLMTGLVVFSWRVPNTYPAKTGIDVSDFIRIFPNLRRVVVSGAFANVKALVCFLKQVCGPTVRELTLHGLELCSSSKELDVPQLDLSALENLGIASARHSDLLLNSILAPKSLAITSYSLWSRSLSLLLAKVAGTLTLLKLDMQSVSNVCGRPFNPQSLPVLEKIALQFVAIRFRYEFHPNSVLHWARNYLHLFEAPELIVLELCFSETAPRDMTYFVASYNWKSFCALLLERYPKIQELTIHVSKRVKATIAFRQSKRAMLENQFKEYIPASFFDDRRITVIWVRVNALLPGVFLSRLAPEFPSGTEISLVPRLPGAINPIPLQRSGREEELGFAAVYLASNAYTNGAHLRVDGGHYLVNP
uniref:Uncharacterized protein n=1 Tax=Moniliophthora roreri TaxID=221103 RepID=A0A0W0FEE4_MONRR